MIVQMSGHSLKGKYSLVGFCTLILNNVIGRRYVVMVNLSCLPLFLLLYIQNTTKKKVYKDFRYHKACTNYGTQIVNLR